MKTLSAFKKEFIGKRTRLQQLREEANLGMREMAKFAGVSVSTLSRIESGKAPDIHTALVLATFCETTVEDLFGEFGPAEVRKKETK